MKKEKKEYVEKHFEEIVQKKRDTYERRGDKKALIWLEKAISNDEKKNI